MPSGPADPRPPEPVRRRVLVVEDSPEDRELVRRYLRADPEVEYEIHEEELGAPGAAWAAAMRPDCVLLDYELPDADGIEVLGRILGAVGPAEFPVIMWTGSGNEDVAVRAMKAGAQDYVIKGGTTPRKLKQVIEAAIARVRLARNLERSRLDLERKHRELEELSARLRRSEARFRRVVESDLIGIFFWTPDGTVTEANDAFLGLVGRGRAEVEAGALNWLALTPGESGAADRAALRALGERGKAPPYEQRFLLPDGGVVDVLAGLAYLDAGREEGVAFVLDIRDRKRAEEALRRSEEQLRQAQKMEAVGRLAGGIAHDFNNLLMSINGYSSLALDELPPESPIRPNLLEVARAGARAASLTHQLLAFSRKQLLAPQVIDLNKVVEGVDRMLQRVIGEDTQVRTWLDPALGRIRVDPGQMEQVILNLAVNARDAMPRGGMLTIQTANVELREHQVGLDHLLVNQTSIPAGRYAMLSVSDTGQGMDEETRKHIFEPFFTTKDVGKGTGLGLSTVYGIVRQSEGSILVYSEPGVGTTFKLYFPIVEGEATPAPAQAPERALSPGKGTILLVEDEDSVRKLVQEILSQRGYRTLAAPDAAAALELARAQDGPIDLLLTDVVMANMGGRELAERLRELRPGIKVIFMSGFTDDAIVRHGTLDASASFLQKPFSPSRLAQKIQDVLQGLEQA